MCFRVGGGGEIRSKVYLGGIETMVPNGSTKRSNSTICSKIIEDTVTTRKFFLPSLGNAITKIIVFFH